jgi:hypothetical protein
MEPNATLGAAWDVPAIRRALRVFGAQPASASDPAVTARALRLVRDMIDRRGIATEVFQTPGRMPLLVAGDGPVLVVSYLDDTHPAAAQHDGSPPEFIEEAASAPGLTRKAGVLAACGALFGAHAKPSAITLVVESDRHAGSNGLEAWLEQSGRRFSGAWWEVVDLPGVAPALFAASMGQLTVRVMVTARPMIEDVYAGVTPDLGYMLAAAMGGLKSADAEVLLPGFYDDVSIPVTSAIEDIERIAASIVPWAAPEGSATSDTRLDHLALGMFLAPSLTIREIMVAEAQPFLPAHASATIDARLTPGQSPNLILRMLTHYLRDRLPGAVIEPLIVRQPGSGRLLQTEGLGDLLPTLPIAPGDSPAGILEASGVPTAGFATVARRGPQEPERIALAAIASGSALLRSLAEATAPAGAPRAT